VAGKSGEGKGKVITTKEADDEFSLAISAMRRWKDVLSTCLKRER